jgi:hypothetical protein
MKKLLCLFGAALLVLTSCSKDDDNSSDSTASILLKKMVYVSTGETYTREFIYNGNKIVSETDNDGYKKSYSYTGDVITKVVEIDENGDIDTTTEYAYTNGKLTSEISLEPGDDYKYKTKYIHNNDGTISFNEFRVSVTTGVEEEYGYVGVYAFKNGNLVKEERSYYGSESASTYEFDTKNNPLKNVLGYILLLDENPSVNNIVKRTSGSEITTNAYTYDANGFPIERKSFINGASDGTSTFTY